MAELVPAEIQQPFFEFRSNFKGPITLFWSAGRQAEIIDVVHRSLSTWRVGLENIEWNQGARNLRDVHLTFGVPSLYASIQVGVAGVTMTALNPDWAHAPELASMFQAGLDAVKGSTGAHFDSQQTTLGFHVKPTAKPFREVVSQFVNAKALGGEDAVMYGVSVYFNDFVFVIDGSAVVPGCVFIKLIRTFTAEKRFEKMAGTLYSDEETVLRRLGLKLQ